MASSPQRTCSPWGEVLDEWPEVFEIDWGQWRPLRSSFSIAEHGQILVDALALESSEIEAIYKYCRFTNHDGIEFVAVGAHLDSMPVRQLAGGVLLVGCNDVMLRRQNNPQFLDRRRFLYDGWLPLPDGSPDAIREGIRAIEEALSVWAFSVHTSIRWFPKYIETCPRHGGYRLMQESEETRSGTAMRQFAELPNPIRDAVARAAHWLQHGRWRHDCL